MGIDHAAVNVYVANTVSRVALLVVNVRARDRKE